MVDMCMLSDRDSDRSREGTITFTVDVKLASSMHALNLNPRVQCVWSIAAYSSMNT